MTPIKAKFAGTCAKTGERYAAGDLIIKNSEGKWQIARNRRGVPKVAPPDPEFRTIRTPDGVIKEHYNIHVLPLCGFCCKADNLMDAVRSGGADGTPYLMHRTGEDFLHERCGRRVHILNDAELWSEAILPNLHFTESYSLNLKVGPEIWGRIGQYFEYSRYADLAEMHEDMDEFELAREYEGMRGGFWSLKNPGDVEKVEELLGILPANRLSVLRIQWAEQEQGERQDMLLRATEIKRQEAGKRALFSREQGEYVPRSAEGVGPAGTAELAEAFDGRLRGQTIPWKDGHNIYGGGEEFVVEEGGAYVWLVQNNGADGDDWSRNNIGTGGAGAIGLRFPATPERLEFLRSLPGGELLGLSKEGRRALLISEIRDRAFAEVSPELKSLFCNEMPAVGKVYAAVWVRLDGHQGLLFGLLPNAQGCYVEVSVPEWHKRRDEYNDAGIEIWDGRITLHYQPTPERVERLRARWPAWVGTDLPGRFRLDRGMSMRLADNAADALRMVSGKKSVTEVVFTPDVTLVHQDNSIAVWSDGVVNKIASYTVYSYARQHSKHRSIEAQADAERALRGETAIDRTPLFRFEDLGFPPVPPESDAPATISPDASRLLAIAVTQSEWREEGRFRQLMAVTSLLEKKSVKKRDGRNTGAELFRLTVEFGANDTRTMWQVDAYWVSRGEDADVGEDSFLFTADEEEVAVEKYETVNQF